MSTRQKIKFDVELDEISQYDYRRHPNDSLIFSSIQELLDFLDGFDCSDCFFRGQSGLWPIKSTVYRWYGEDFEKARNISVAAVRWLKNNKYIQNVVCDNDDYALAIAQHYGCPTDLVDITTDIMTAAYFATSDNEKHNETPEGCIWIFPRCEIGRLQDMMKTQPGWLFSKLPKELADKFIGNKYNQLFQVDMPQLSRLNAQKGAFLWDMGDILNYQLDCAHIGTRLVFKHRANERDSFTGEIGRLFPLHNQLESEIMRIFTEDKSTDAHPKLPKYFGAIDVAVLEQEGILKNGLLPEIVDNAKETMFFQLPDIFNPSFGEYAWTQRTVSQNNYKPRKINMSEFIECRIPLNLNGALSLVNRILKSIDNNCLTDLSLIFYINNKEYSFCDGDKQVLVVMVVTLTNYLYTVDEIAQVVLEWMKMLIFKQDNGYLMNREIALVLGYVNDWIAKYYDCRVTKLHLYEGTNFTRFWLPENYTFLDNNGQNEFSAFNKRCYEIPKTLQSYYENLPDNAKMFFYQHRPQKIMPYDNMKKMFIDLILPQHFAFRYMHDIIYIPDYVTQISLPVFGTTQYITENFSENMDNVGDFIII